jgi:hypothetical protein
MAQLVLIISPSGTGKSSSLRNLTKEEAAVVLCSGKDLPFRHDLSTFVPKNYIDIFNVIEQSKKPVIVIDDVNYMMSFEEMNRVNEAGYAKFTQMANNMFQVFKKILDKPSDQTFYLMAHAAEDEDGKIRFKTTGKMLSEKIVLEGLTNIVIANEILDGEFVFRVQTNGTGIKTPIGMFETPTIPNDLKLVDQVIRKFYNKTTKPAAKAPGNKGDKK